MSVSTATVRAKLARAEGLGVDVTVIRRALNLAREGGKLTHRVLYTAERALDEAISAADPGVRKVSVPQTGRPGKKVTGNGGAYKGRSAVLAHAARYTLPAGHPDRLTIAHPARTV